MVRLKSLDLKQDQFNPVIKICCVCVHLMNVLKPCSDWQQLCMKKQSPLIHLNGVSSSVQRGCQCRWLWCLDFLDCISLSHWRLKQHIFTTAAPCAVLTEGRFKFESLITLLLALVWSPPTSD